MRLEEHVTLITKADLWKEPNVAIIQRKTVAYLVLVSHEVITTFQLYRVRETVKSESPSQSGFFLHKTYWWVHTIWRNRRTPQLRCDPLSTLCHGEGAVAIVDTRWQCGHTLDRLQPPPKPIPSYQFIWRHYLTYYKPLAKNIHRLIHKHIQNSLHLPRTAAFCSSVSNLWHLIVKCWASEIC